MIGAHLGRSAERLCCWSSVLPWSLIPEDGVEDREELPHASGEGELGGSPGGSEALIEVFDGVISAGSGECGHVQGAADIGASALDHAPVEETPESLLIGATPTRAAILRRSRPGSPRRERASPSPSGFPPPHPRRATATSGAAKRPSSSARTSRPTSPWG